MYRVFQILNYWVSFFPWLAFLKLRFMTLSSQLINVAMLKVDNRYLLFVSAGQLMIYNLLNLIKINSEGINIFVAIC